MTFADAGGGSYNLLSTTNVTSGTANVDITSNIDSTYKNYLLTFTDVHPQTDDVRLRFRLYSSHGSPDSSSRYMYGGVGKRSDNADPDHNSASTTQGEISIGAQGNAGVESESGLMWMFNPSGTTYNKHIFIQSIMLDYSGKMNMGNTGFNYDAGAVAYTGIRFFYSSGNIDTGTFKLYGIS